MSEESIKVEPCKDCGAERTVGKPCPSCDCWPEWREGLDTFKTKIRRGYLFHAHDVLPAPKHMRLKGSKTSTKGPRWGPNLYFALLQAPPHLVIVIPDVSRKELPKFEKTVFRANKKSLKTHRHIYLARDGSIVIYDSRFRPFQFSDTIDYDQVPRALCLDLTEYEIPGTPRELRNPEVQLLRPVARREVDFDEPLHTIEEPT